MVTFSLLIFSQFLCSKALYREKLSVLHDGEKQIGTSHISQQLDLKYLWKGVNPAENSRNCRSLVFLIWIFCLTDNFENTWRQKFWSIGTSKRFASSFSGLQGFTCHSAILKLQHPFLIWAACMRILFEGSAVCIQKTINWSEILLIRKSFRFITKWYILQLVGPSC